MNLQIEDENIYAGTDGEYYESFSDYPSSAYDLEVTFKYDNDFAQQLIVTSQDDDSFLIAYTNSQLQPGRNRWQYKFTNKTTGKVSIPYSGFKEVEPELNSDYDPRSHANKMLSALEAMAEGRATMSILNNSYKGKSFQLLTLQEIREAIAYYRDIVEREENEAILNNGGQTPTFKFGFARNS